jgi:hypothetical protein
MTFLMVYHDICHSYECGSPDTLYVDKYKMCIL